MSMHYIGNYIRQIIRSSVKKGKGEGVICSMESAKWKHAQLKFSETLLRFSKVLIQGNDEDQSRP